jgi:hypothetical protein
MTMAQGYALERLSDISEGHAVLLREIEGWMQSQTSAAKGSRAKKKERPK